MKSTPRIYDSLILPAAVAEAQARAAEAAAAGPAPAGPAPARPAPHTPLPPPPPEATPPDGSAPRMPPIDELMLAKLRLLALQRPPQDRLAALRQYPWAVGAAALAGGFLLGRSRLVRGLVAAGLTWGVRKAVTSQLQRQGRGPGACR